MRRLFDAIGARAEVDAVEIHLQNLRLGELSLEPQRKQRFLELAVDRAFLRQEEILGELLRDGRTALRDGAVQHVGDKGTPDAEWVDAVVFVETAILDGDECLRHIARHFSQRQRLAGEIAAARKCAALDVDNLDRRRALGNFQRLDGRQMRAGPGDDADTGDAEPQAGHQTPVGNPADARADAAGRALLACAAFARLRRRRVVSGRCAVARRHAQFGAVVVIGRRLPARACCFLLCGHTQLVPRRRMHDAGPRTR